MSLAELKIVASLGVNCDVAKVEGDNSPNHRDYSSSSMSKQRNFGTTGALSNKLWSAKFSPAATVAVQHSLGGTNGVALLDVFGDAVIFTLIHGFFLKNTGATILSLDGGDVTNGWTALFPNNTDTITIPVGAMVGFLASADAGFAVVSTELVRVTNTDGVVAGEYQVTAFGR